MPLPSNHSHQMADESFEYVPYNSSKVFVSDSYEENGFDNLATELNIWLGQNFDTANAEASIAKALQKCNDLIQKVREHCAAVSPEYHFGIHPLKVNQNVKVYGPISVKADITDLMAQ